MWTECKYDPTRRECRCDQGSDRQRQRMAVGLEATSEPSNATSSSPDIGTTTHLASRGGQPARSCARVPRATTLTKPKSTSTDHSKSALEPSSDHSSQPNGSWTQHHSGRGTRRVGCIHPLCDARWLNKNSNNSSCHPPTPRWLAQDVVVPRHVAPTVPAVHLTGVKGTAPRCKAPLHATSNPPSHECPSIPTQSTRRFIDSMVDWRGADHCFLSQLIHDTDRHGARLFHIVVIVGTHRNSW